MQISVHPDRPRLGKAAVRDMLEGPLTPDVPASILREHADCRLHIDRPAAGLLRQDS